MEDEDHFELTHRLGRSTERKKWICVAVVLGVILAIALLVIAALSAVMGINLSSPQSTTGSHISLFNLTISDDRCWTPACIDLSGTIRQALDENIDPCEDFYNFSCGGFEKRNVVPPGEMETEMALQLKNRNYIAIKKILESGRVYGAEAVRKAFAMYKSCMDTSAIQMAGITPLYNLINKSGGWSLLDGKDSGWYINGKSFVLERLLSSQAFFSISPEVDPMNTTRYIINLFQSGLSLGDPASYLDSNNTNALKVSITNVLSHLAPELNETVVQEAVAGIVDLEAHLAEVFEDVSNLTQNITKNYKLRDLGNLSKLWPAFNWLNFTNALFGAVNVTVKSNEPVFVITPNYFSNLTSVLMNASNQTLENYAKWHTIRPYLSYLSINSDIYSGMSQEALMALGLNSVVGEQRYKLCITFVQSSLPLALGRIFATNISQDYAKGNTSVMMKYVKGAFTERIDTNDWLDNTTKTRCKEKVKAVSSFISYPDQLFNDTYLNDLYSKYMINSTDYFGNYQQTAALTLQDSLNNLHTKVSKEKIMWSNPPTQVNAFYNPQVNSLIIMEGISRPPWFDPRWPEYFKFGALGAVAGHELTHGFDNKGRNYDKDGNFRRWWTEKSIAEFENKQQCFVSQYSNYELFGHNVTGAASLPDNIADNGGLKVSFQAYKDYVSAHPTTVNNRLLPALSKYSPDQLYFIAWAQLWCAIYTEEGFSVAAKESHSPSPFRVVGTVVNSPEFAKAFSCPSGSKMNPEHKCLMW